MLAPPFTPRTPMQTFVYASRRKPDTYVWLRDQDRFDVLPAELSARLGELRFVLAVELTPERQLPRADVATVLADLQRQGWHLQLPPAGATIG